jgi:transposase InsO family protein
LGIAVSQSTVATYMRRHPRPPSQTWRTFLTNHASQIAAADLFVVPTVTFRLLFVLVMLAHDQRRIMHADVTAHPTADGVAPQLRNAFPEDQAPRFLVHDRDGAFAEVATTVAGMHIEPVRTAPRSPWQNADVERLIGSIRRKCLDHVIVVNEASLRRVLASYVTYYMRSRTHLVLAKDSPMPRPAQPAPTGGSWPRRKWVACTTATIASRRSHAVREGCFPPASYPPRSTRHFRYQRMHRGRPAH